MLRKRPSGNEKHRPPPPAPLEQGSAAAARADSRRLWFNREAPSMTSVTLWAWRRFGEHIYSLIQLVMIPVNQQEFNVLRHQVSHFKFRRKFTASPYSFSLSPLLLFLLPTFPRDLFDSLQRAGAGWCHLQVRCVGGRRAFPVEEWRLSYNPVLSFYWSCIEFWSIFCSCRCKKKKEKISLSSSFIVDFSFPHESFELHLKAADLWRRYIPSEGLKCGQECSQIKDKFNNPP